MRRRHAASRAAAASHHAAASLLAGRLRLARSTARALEGTWRTGSARRLAAFTKHLLYLLIDEGGE